MDDTTIVPPSLPFLWRGKEDKILAAGIEKDKAYASVEPHDSILVAELKRRIKKDSGLSIYLCAGYVCFVEDYHKMQSRRQS